MSRKKQHWIKGSCVLLAIVFHLVLFVVLFGSNVLALFSPSNSEGTRNSESDELSQAIIVELEDMVIAELLEQTLEEPAEEPEPPTPPKPKRFLKTSDRQLTGVPEKDTSAFGERDTIAASNAEATADAPAVAAQAGEKARFQGDLRTIEGVYADGQIGSLASRSEAGGSSAASVLSSRPFEEQVKPEPLVKPEPEQTEKEPDRSPEVEEPKPDENSQLREQEESELKQDVNPFQSANQSKATEQKATPSPLEEPGESQPPEVEKKKLPTAKQGKAKSEEQKSDAPRSKGFESGGRTTKLLGSISRRSSVSSQDVVASPLGRYQAAVSQAIEREWMANCTKYREFINPGVITIRFYVDGQGDVHKARFMDIVEGSEIQKGFTLQSVKKAKIPSMPAQVKEDQDGELLELIYNFIF